MEPRGIFSAHFVTPSQGQGHWKRYKMVEVNGAYKHGKHERNLLKSLRLTANIESFATQDQQIDGQMDKETTAGQAEKYDRLHDIIMIIVLKGTETINWWRRGGNQSTRREPLTTSLRKCHILKPENSNHNPDLNQPSSIAVVSG